MSANGNLKLTGAAPSPGCLEKPNAMQPCPNRAHSLPSVLAGCVLAIAAGCGGLSEPGASSNHATVPPQAVNAESLGIIRVRFDRSAQAGGASRRDALDAWMRNHGMECPRLDYLLEQLGKAGFDTAIAVIPGDTAILDDAGIYVGGPSTKAADDLEDALIKTGGFSIGGLAASKLQVVSLGNGWFFVGINGDGVIDGASDGAAARMSDILDQVGDRPFCAAVPIEGLDATLADIAPGDQSRLIRRLRAAAAALDDAIALSVGVTADGRSEVALVFPDEESAAALDKAASRIRRDLQLSVEGSLEQGEFTAEQAAAARAQIDAMRFVQRGKTVVVYEESAGAPGS